MSDHKNIVLEPGMVLQFAIKSRSCPGCELRSNIGNDTAKDVPIQLPVDSGLTPLGELRSRPSILLSNRIHACSVFYILFSSILLTD